MKTKKNEARRKKKYKRAKDKIEKCNADSA